MITKDLLSRINRIDWDFTGSSSDSSFSNIHWHPGRFMSQIPAALIGMFSSVKDVVLDPFVGSGTTLFEAQRLGRRSIGIDVNKISVLISKSKTLSCTAIEIGKIINSIIVDATNSIESESKSIVIPDSVQKDKWYTPNVQKDLGRLWYLANEYEGNKKLLAQAVFSSILLPVCREDRHWGYVCDNTLPKSDYEQDVLSYFVNNLNKYKIGYHQRDEYIGNNNTESIQLEESVIFDGNNIDILKKIQSQSVDLILTSPPYYGVVDYVKSQRLSMEWFCYNLEETRLLEIGARSKRHRKNSFGQYTFEIGQTIHEIRRVLKPKGWLIFLIGQSSSRKHVLDEIVDIFHQEGFKIDADFQRRVSPQRRQSPSILDEQIFICSPKDLQ